MNGKDWSDWTIVGNCLTCRAPLYRWEIFDDETSHYPRWTCGCAVSSRGRGKINRTEREEHGRERKEINTSN